MDNDYLFSIFAASHCLVSAASVLSICSVNNVLPMVELTPMFGGLKVFAHIRFAFAYVNEQSTLRRIPLVLISVHERTYYLVRFFFLSWHLTPR